MSQATATVPEFPFVESLPSVVVEEARKGMDAFKQVVREYEEAQAQYGLLVPISTVAESLGVSAARVTALIDENRLAAVVVTGRRWVVAASVMTYIAAGPKQTGRPKKLSKVGNSYRVGKELADAAEGLMK
jgi:hypothetical protein